MTFRLIEAEKAQHPVSLLCSVLGVTRAGYYAWRQRGPSRRALGDAELASLIRRVFVESLEIFCPPDIHLRSAAGKRFVFGGFAVEQVEGCPRRELCLNNRSQVSLNQPT